MKYRILYSLVLLVMVMSLPAFSPGKTRKKSVRGKTPAAVKPVKKAKTAPGDSAASPYYIIVDKSDYELKVYDEEGWYATYPVVFGSKDLRDKFREGDKRTPDGTFKVILKKIHNKWGPELLLDYPNNESFRRFKERRQSGQVPASAKIGNGIAIHATRPDEEWTVDNFYNWTDGCVSVKYTEMKDLYSYIPVGTVVTIQQ